MSLLRKGQLDAISKMRDGCILCGGTGSGKSRTSLYYYFKEYGGKLLGENYIPMKDPPDLYIITTARKRDELEWDEELLPFMLSTNSKYSYYKNHKVIIDSWNNIGKYVNVQNAFFIFDEQKASGKGEWSKHFIAITKINRWILLSATPGDKWEDYIPVFIANGFYKNRTEFVNEHVIYKAFYSYPVVDRYTNTGKLIRLRESLLVDIVVERTTVQNHIDIWTNYDTETYKWIHKHKKNPWTNEPIPNKASFCFILRKLINSDVSRQVALFEILEKHDRVIVFYNFDYELDILKSLTYAPDVEVKEWNGHKHEKVPTTNRWIYFVQYSSGNEAWNCISTDTIVFWSQNYSYRITKQASGRIDRLNTQYTDLYYYHFKSKSSIDLGIQRALKKKKTFNEREYVKNW